MQVVINKCFGGFGLSYEGMMKYAELKGIELYAYSQDYSRGSGTRPYELYTGEGKEPFSLHYCTKQIENDGDLNDNYFSGYDIKRNDPALVKTVEELGSKANGSCAELAIVEVPGYVSWYIEEYDGNEHVAEKHETWG